MVHQRYTIPPAVDVTVEVDRQWERLKNRLDISAGSRIAVGVGSRGIADLVEVVRAVIAKLKEAGCKPFIIPAMGSHGGATAEGQIKVLAHLGINEFSIGAPIDATMDVQSMDEVDGIPLFLDRLAYEADGIVLINRIKPHTDFSGPTESGIIKMMAIGLGNQIGADHYHQLAVIRDMYEIFSKAGLELIRRTNFLFGVGLVENQEHRTANLKMMPAHTLAETEAELLKKSKAYFPRLPLKEIDLLVVDEIGKEISGAGMDPNVTGRTTAAACKQPSEPKVSRIFVRDLTDASEGNAIGIGEADFTTRRLVDKIDFEAMALNCVTCCCPESGQIPISFSTDRQAIAAAMMTIRPHTLVNLKLVYIKNTLELGKILVSRGCLPDLEGKPEVHISPDDFRLGFDSTGNLVSPF
jgi:hypothetical protein